MTSPVVTFGAADGDEAYLFTMIRSVIRTADGAIVVADQTPRVAVFAADGTWRRDLARRGRGPGELQLPTGLWMHAEDTVAIWDALQRKVVMYPLVDGRPREVAVHWGSPSRPVDGAGGRMVIELEAGQLMDTARAHSRLVALSSGDPLTIVGPYDVPEIGWVVEENGIGHMVSPPVFETYPAWEVTASGVWWADPSSNTIRKVDWSGRDVTATHLPEQPAHLITDADRDAFYEGLATRYGVGRPIGDTEPFADTAPDVTAIVADDQGLLWLAGFDPGADPLRGWIGAEYTVVDAADDRVHTTVTFPDGFTLTDVAAGLALGFHEDDAGIHFVHVYDVSAVYDEHPAARASQ